MKKMIENVIPFPVGCETSRFFGAASSMHMAVLQETENLKHEFIFHVLYAVSGAGLFRLHQSSVPHTIKGYDANEMNNFILDYIPYSINYLGYGFKKLSAGEKSKEIIWSEITASIDKNIPVLLKVSGTIQWNVICGYGENTTLYGLDAKDHYDKIAYTSTVKPEGYVDNGYFYDSKWYESLEYVLICTPEDKSITFKTALLRMCFFIENHLSNGFNANTLLLKNCDGFFADKSDEYLKNLYSYIDSILGYLMEASHHVSEAFGAVWKRFIDNPAVNPQLQDLFSKLDGTITKTQGTVWEHWNYKPEGLEKYTLLKNQEFRNTLLAYLYRIAEDDKNALELIRQAIDLIDDDYIDTSV
ncbi:MAG: hypothetical protein LBI03_09180 [Clostridiales bacterium]|jgi:hypothetical protein|nr:hypothetical protein [Clostridiales bacterium]